MSTTNSRLCMASSGRRAIASAFGGRPVPGCLRGPRRGGTSWCWFGSKCGVVPSRHLSQRAFVANKQKRGGARAMVVNRSRAAPTPPKIAELFSRCGGPAPTPEIPLFRKGCWCISPTTGALDSDYIEHLQPRASMKPCAVGAADRRPRAVAGHGACDGPDRDRCSHLLPDVSAKTERVVTPLLFAGRETSRRRAPTRSTAILNCHSGPRGRPSASPAASPVLR